MRAILPLAVTGAVLGAVVGAGCEQTPDDLPMLYNQRAVFQRMIDEVETKYGIPSRDATPVDDLRAVRAQAEEDCRARVAAIENSHRLQVDGLREVLRTLQGTLERLQGQWFRELPKPEQVEWLMHRDNLRLEWTRFLSELDLDLASWRATAEILRPDDVPAEEPGAR